MPKSQRCHGMQAPLLKLLKAPGTASLGSEMLNRLTDPAKKLAPQIGEILESVWHAGLRTCQLTGSGSACFAISASQAETEQAAINLQTSLEPGACDCHPDHAGSRADRCVVNTSILAGTPELPGDAMR